ncbi:MAG: PilZ domain-containing protein [Cellvibrionaceae bacterium]
MKGRERREQPRMRLDGQSSRIQTRVIWPNQQDLDSDCIEFVDISRSGFGLQTRHEFSVGQSLKLEVSIDEASPIILVAVICNCRGRGTDFRYGAYFEYDAEPDDAYTESVLIEMEREIRAQARADDEAC